MSPTSYQTALPRDVSHKRRCLYYYRIFRMSTGFRGCLQFSFIFYRYPHFRLPYKAQSRLWLCFATDGSCQMAIAARLAHASPLAGLAGSLWHSVRSRKRIAHIACLRRATPRLRGLAGYRRGWPVLASSPACTWHPPVWSHPAHQWFCPAAVSRPCRCATRRSLPSYARACQAAR